MPVGELYEVRCNDCNVSFPPGTKTCLHCKGRLGKRRPQAPPAPTMRTQGMPAEASRELEATGFAEQIAAREEEESSTPRRVIRLGVNLLWILGAIVVTAAQMCRGGG